MAACVVAFILILILAFKKAIINAGKASKPFLQTQLNWNQIRLVWKPVWISFSLVQSTKNAAAKSKLKLSGKVLMPLFKLAYCYNIEIKLQFALIKANLVLFLIACFIHFLLCLISALIFRKFYFLQINIRIKQQIWRSNSKKWSKRC